MVWVPESMTERDEIEFVRQLTAIRDALGPEAFERMAIEFGRAHEAEIRKTASADHPMLQLLDEIRSKEERGFE